MREKQLGFAFKGSLPRLKSEDQQKTEKILMDEMLKAWQHLTEAEARMRQMQEQHNPLDRNGNEDDD